MVLKRVGDAVFSLLQTNGRTAARLSVSHNGFGCYTPTLRRWLRLEINNTKVWLEIKAQRSGRCVQQQQHI